MPRGGEHGRLFRGAIGAAGLVSLLALHDAALQNYHAATPNAKDGIERAAHFVGDQGQMVAWVAQHHTGPDTLPRHVLFADLEGVGVVLTFAIGGVATARALDYHPG